MSTVVGSGGDIWGMGDSEGVEEGHVGRLVERYDMLVLCNETKSCDHGIVHGSSVAVDDGTAKQLSKTMSNR